MSGFYKDISTDTVVSAAEADALASENAAATSAAAASSSAAAASSSESNSATSLTAAEAARDAALAAFDAFGDRYLGDKASDPTVDDDGDALVAGTLYFNTTDRFNNVVYSKSKLFSY